MSDRGKEGILEQKLEGVPEAWRGNGDVDGVREDNRWKEGGTKRRSLEDMWDTVTGARKNLRCVRRKPARHSFAARETRDILKKSLAKMMARDGSLQNETWVIANKLCHSGERSWSWDNFSGRQRVEKVQRKLRTNVGYEEEGVGGKIEEELMVCFEEIPDWKVLEAAAFNSGEASGYVTEGVFSGKDAEYEV